MSGSDNNEVSELHEKLMGGRDDSNIDLSYINQTQQQLGISLQEYQTGNNFASGKNDTEFEESKGNNNDTILEQFEQENTLQEKSQLKKSNMNNRQSNQNNNTLPSSDQVSINFNIPQTANGNQKEIVINTDFGLSSSHGSDAHRNGSMLEVNAQKLNNSRVDYQDLDELHEDLLDERENQTDEGNCLYSMFRCFKKKETHSDNWLKHFKLLVKNTRFIENSWSGGLFNLINTRFQDYKHNDTEQQELHLNAQNTLDDQKLKRESSNQAVSSKRTTLENRQNSKQSGKSLSTEIGTESTPGGEALITKEIKLAIKNSVILEEDIESVRESLKQEQILAQIESIHDALVEPDFKNSINHLNEKSYAESQQDREYYNNDQYQQKTISVITDDKNFKTSNLSNLRAVTRDERGASSNKTSKMEILGRSIDIVTQQNNSDAKAKLKLESKYKSRIRSSSLKKRVMQNQNMMSRNGSEKRTPSFTQNVNDSRFEEAAQSDEQGDDALGLVNNSIKTNTLLINSEFLQEKDFELYQAVVYYKSITFVIEQHLLEENNFTQEKPLRVIRDNFIEYYVRQYGKNLQRLEESEIIESIQDLKEFVTLYLEIIREYYKLDELVDKCTYADRFITTDNLINFLCSVVFLDDAIYSIVYVSHCHFENKLSLKYFKVVKHLHQNIGLGHLKVNEEYCLNEQTLTKLQKKMAKQNCSINDTNILKGYSFVPPYQKAYEHFKTIAYQRSPVHKLKVIIKTQDLINECIKDFYDYFGIDYADIYYDADNLVGIFSYILIKSEVYDIIAHCKIIENFATKNTLNSHSGYLLVTLQCCIRFISTINPQVLLNENRLELNKL